eukprot:6147864-Amphidinium_carterae.1
MLSARLGVNSLPDFTRPELHQQFHGRKRIALAPSTEVEPGSKQLPDTIPSKWRKDFQMSAKPKSCTVWGLLVRGVNKKEG